MNSIIDKIPGQQRIKLILNNFLLSKIFPNAFLFTGPEGVGKDNAAIQFAKAIVFSQSKSEAGQALRLIEQLQEPYLKLIFPLPRGKNEVESSSPTEKLTQDELELVIEQLDIKAKNLFHKISIPKANTIKINSIRDIKKFLSMDYEEVGFRFVIISEAHLMNEESQNSLLKSLEEPPEKVIFILTTSFPSKLRSTILSRCWRINFDPLDNESVVSILTNYFDIDKKTAEEVAPFAMGSVQNALRLLMLDFHILKEKTISVLRYSFGRKFHSAFNELNSVFSDQNSASFQTLVNMIITWVNDIQRHRLQFNRYFYKDYLETLEKFNRKFPKVDLNGLTSRLDKLSNLPQNNINPSLLSANLVFELASVVLEQQ